MRNSSMNVAIMAALSGLMPTISIEQSQPWPPELGYRHTGHPRRTPQKLKKGVKRSYKNRHKKGRP